MPSGLGSGSDLDKETFVWLKKPLECEVVRVYFNSTNVATGRFELLMSPWELHSEAWKERE
jgi:hypothetical protein